VALVGAGRVATALGVLLARAGHDVVAASGRAASRERVALHLPAAKFVSDAGAAQAARTILLGVPDDLIEPTTAALAAGHVLGPGRRLVHLSGSVSLEALAPARESGAGVLSMHPLQSFPDVETGIERMPGSGVGVTAAGEADAAFGEELARDVGGRPFRISDTVKPLYHAAAVFSSNYLVIVEALAERLLAAAGVEEAAALLEPLARTSFDRTFSLGPTAALTGPASRGDAGTIRRNLEALAAGAPDAVPPYAALAAAAAGMAEEAGRLTREQRLALEEAIRPWK
jgi:predicted short-subunit dehydrogenase-like oxidoreductase (DUF2520 family)